MTNLTAAQLTARLDEVLADGADAREVRLARECIANGELDSAHRILLDQESAIYL